jgi:6-phosphogluconate dehydrogenase
MVSGARDAFEEVAPLLRSLAVDDNGVFFAGSPGAGHFVKLVYNAIEFGMVQAIAEGVELLDEWEEQLDIPGLFDNWMHGSVIRSWLVELMGKALREQRDLEELSTYVEDTGEVKWVLDWALEHDIPIPVTSASQTALMQYRDLDSPQAKAHALLRNQCGGHPLHRVKDKEARR